MVSVAVSLKGDSKRGDFRISSVRCHMFHDSAVCLCLGCSQPHSDLLFVCVLVCGCSDFSCCGVVMAYLSFCLFGSTELLDSSWKSKKSCPHSCCNTVVRLKDTQFDVWSFTIVYIIAVEVGIFASCSSRRTTL